ncbi:PDEase domain-containing protein [Aphelenchoides fujianensis]|nr:PDEase domain-containing protein [Aphelenchoides fujianensis]
MPVSPYMNRAEPAVAKLQDSFIAHIVSPLVMALNEAGLLPVLPGLEEPEVLINLKHNHSKWLAEIEEQQEADAEETEEEAETSEPPAVPTEEVAKLSVGNGRVKTGEKEEMGRLEPSRRSRTNSTPNAGQSTRLPPLVRDRPPLTPRSASLADGDGRKDADHTRKSWFRLPNWHSFGLCAVQHFEDEHEEYV